MKPTNNSCQGSSLTCFQGVFYYLGYYRSVLDPFPAGPATSDTMIPLGSDSQPRLVVGHNVAYDRIRVGDEYRLERSGTRYLDTMAMHIAVAGMTSSQRLVWQSSKNMTEEELRHKPRWLCNTAPNSLAEVHKFYCGGPPLNKETCGNIFRK